MLGNHKRFLILSSFLGFPLPSTIEKFYNLFSCHCRSHSFCKHSNVFTKGSLLVLHFLVTSITSVQSAGFVFPVLKLFHYSTASPCFLQAYLSGVFIQQGGPKEQKSQEIIVHINPVHADMRTLSNREINTIWFCTFDIALAIFMDFLVSNIDIMFISVQCIFPFKHSTGKYCITNAMNHFS